MSPSALRFAVNRQIVKGYVEFAHVPNEARIDPARARHPAIINHRLEQTAAYSDIGGGLFQSEPATGSRAVEQAVAHG